jgi:hypothetical protein
MALRQSPDGGVGGLEALMSELPPGPPSERADRRTGTADSRRHLQDADGRVNTTGRAGRIRDAEGGEV